MLEEQTGFDYSKIMEMFSKVMNILPALVIAGTIGSFVGQRKGGMWGVISGVLSFAVTVMALQYIMPLFEQLSKMFKKEQGKE